MKLTPISPESALRPFTTDPAAMSPDARLEEIAQILAAGYRRLSLAKQTEDQLAEDSLDEPTCALRTQENES